MNYLYKEKVRKYIIENFPLAIEISNIAPIFLIGGALRDIELLTPPKDLDFVVLSDTDEIIKTFIEKNNLKYKINKLGGYKIYNNTVVVDLWNTNDLLKSIEYNIEGLFYLSLIHISEPTICRIKLIIFYQKSDIIITRGE
mgnify:CR=1 FL=1